MTQEYTTDDLVKSRIGITDTVDDVLLAEIVSEANDWLEGKIGFPVGPIASETRLFDGTDVLNGRLRCYPFGVRIITAIRYATETGGVYTSLTSLDWSAWIRPRAYKRPTGWPGFEIIIGDTDQLSDWPTYGRDLIEVTATWGWDAIPPELTSIATRIAVALYHGKGFAAGRNYSPEDAVNDPGVLSGTDWRAIHKYKSLGVTIG